PAPPFPPPALNPTSFLQPIEERVERRHMKLQLAGRPVLDELADLVAVTRAGFENRQDNQLRRALLQLAGEHARVYSCHNHICYRRRCAAMQGRWAPPAVMLLFIPDSRFKRFQLAVAIKLLA